MRLGDILRGRGGRLHAIDPGAPIIEALQLLELHEIGALLVRSAERTEGIFTERDGLRACRSGADLSVMPVREVMTRRLVGADAREPISEAMEHMVRHHVRHLPVVDGDAIVGIVSLRDLAAALCSGSGAHLGADRARPGVAATAPRDGNAAKDGASALAHRAREVP